MRELDDEKAALNESLKTVRSEIQSQRETITITLLPDADATTVSQAVDETAATVLPEQLRALQAELEATNSRIEAIETDEAFLTSAETLDPTTGTLQLALTTTEAAVERASLEIDGFETEAFLWLFNRRYHEPTENNAFGKFMRVVTLANRREQRALASVREHFGTEDFKALVDDYQTAIQAHQSALEAADRARQTYDAVRALVEQHAELGKWRDNYDALSLEKLRETLDDHLQSCDLTEFYGQVSQTHRGDAAKLHALSKKDEYLTSLDRYLKRERDDRATRIASIQSVKQKWQRRPGDALRGDKTRWLKTTPEMKRAGTRKRVGWVRTIHHNVYHYDDYDHYQTRWAGGSYLAYDTFAELGDERMPYDGFTRDVIEDVGSDRADREIFPTDEIDMDLEIDDVADETFELAAANALAEESLDGMDDTMEDLS
ncbi:MAG: hypothetical protein AAF458_12170 [Pseudomonadota bacterium]